MYFLSSSFWPISNVELSCYGLDMHSMEGMNLYFFS